MIVKDLQEKEKIKLPNLSMSSKNQTKAPAQIPQNYKKFSEEIFLINLKNRNNLNRSKIQRILEKIAETFVPCENCTDCIAAENLTMIQKESIKENLKPEIRIYDKPVTMTYEASIKSGFFSDTYLTMSNIAETDIFNIKFQKKPFMNFIWLSVILISLGGLMNFFNRKKII